MSDQQKSKTKREFGLSSLALDNSTSVFILGAIIAVMGVIVYQATPKQQFPDIVMPTVYVNTIYPGNSPVDIENLITRPIEKELKSVKGVKKIESSSVVDVSAIVVEFNEDVKIDKAVQDVKDAVDKAKRELPSDLDTDPTVLEMDFTEIPIMTINISGDFEIEKLNKYAETLEDEIEALTEVSKVDITGNVDREIQVNADIFKMEARNVTFGDIENAIAAENVAISGGDIIANGQRKPLRITGEFEEVEEIRNIIVKAESGNIIYLRDVAEVKDTYVDRKSYARLATNNFLEEGSSPVVSLRVVKKGGENLINADAKIMDILDKAKQKYLPPSLNIIITENQADNMKMQISNLENSIISGVILVVLVLLFFMGLRNAAFVGIAIPLSMMMAFMIIGMVGITVNIVVLFGLILALGMLVDNAIVVVENIYRLMEEGLSRAEASKQGIGEVAVAIISSTATTLAAFVPLAFWGGLMGEFMKWLPITLIIVLSCSLFVGLIINPVVAKSFMKVENPKHQTIPRWVLIVLISTTVMGLGLDLATYFNGGSYALGNMLATVGILGLANIFLLRPAANYFQNVILVTIEKFYLRVLKFALRGIMPYVFLVGTVAMLILAFLLLAIAPPKTEFFPAGDPLFAYMYIEAPQGTNVERTNELTEDLEKQVYEVLEPYKSIVKSVITNVGEGTGNPQEGFAPSFTPNKSRISVAFVDFQDRNGINTADVIRDLAEMAKDVPGLKIKTERNQDGPPTGKPVSIEVVGEDYEDLISEATRIYQAIDDANIPGLDGLGLELDIGKPEMILNIDRSKARQYGLSTGMIASALRTALYGKEVSKFKEGEDEYPIQLRLKKEYRNNPTALKDQRITFRTNDGQLRQVPVSAVADLSYTSTFGSVKRKDLDRLVVVSAGVLDGYNANEIVNDVKNILKDIELKTGYSYKFGGEQEEQAKAMAFLGNAMLIALAAIALILVSQFNSATKPFIIMLSVIFSLIGVFLGLVIFRNDFVIVMTGIGIISLAGVVVNNAIVLIDYIDLTRKRKREELDLAEEERLSNSDLVLCLVEAGYKRLRPVLLTAITTVLGLIPLATGMNINFFTLYSSFDPEFFMGGENAAFWGPMSWAVIYGLTFATFLTLVIVPVLYLIVDQINGLFVRKTVASQTSRAGIRFEKN